MITKPQDGWVSRKLNRPISTRISRLLFKTPVTPNQITIVVFSIGLLASYLMLSGYFLAGTLAMHISSVLDGCDGEIARMKDMKSRLGAWLDTISDYVIDAIFIFCVALGLYFTKDLHIFLYAGIATLTLHVLTSSLVVLRLIKENEPDSCKLEWFDENRGAGFVSRLVAFTKPLIKRDLYYFVFIFIAAAGLTQLIVLFSFLGALGGIYGVGSFYFVRRNREVSATKIT